MNFRLEVTDDILTGGAEGYELIKNNTKVYLRQSRTPKIILIFLEI